MKSGQMILLGITKPSDGAGEYKVYYHVITGPAFKGYADEASSCYCDDLEDARGTIVDMCQRARGRGEACYVRRGRYTDDLVGVPYFVDL